MAPPTMLTAAQLLRLIGLPDTPAIIDVRSADDLDADPRRLPGALRRDVDALSAWAGEIGPEVIIVCATGLASSQGVAAWLRQTGVQAETLEGGFAAWRDAGGPLLRPDALPAPDASGRTLWVTRTRPKVDRIACPWLIRRFVDPGAAFLFVAPGEVIPVAKQFGAVPFDVDGVFWSHRGPLCTFDVMLEEFGLQTPALDRLAAIVRAADTARLDLAPQAAGLLAASLGLSRMYKDDLAQLDAGMALYDAFYRWSRDANEETHDWPAPKAAQRTSAWTA